MKLLNLYQGCLAVFLSLGVPAVAEAQSQQQSGGMRQGDVPKWSSGERAYGGHAQRRSGGGLDGAADSLSHVQRDSGRMVEDAGRMMGTARRAETMADQWDDQPRRPHRDRGHRQTEHSDGRQQRQGSSNSLDAGGLGPLLRQVR